MRYIDMGAWPRHKHFEFFQSFEDPHFNLCAAVEVTALRAAVKQRGLSFSVALVYLLARAANGIPEFRQRIRGNQVVEHEVVHPSITVLTPGDLFGFCAIRYSGDFATFAARAAEAMACAQAYAVLEDGPDEDALLFMTAIPWLSFTGLIHPIPRRPPDSVPRIAWGRFRPAGDRLEMPLSIHAHHGLVDGIHVGRYFSDLQRMLDEPGMFL